VERKPARGLAVRAVQSVSAAAGGLLVGGAIAAFVITASVVEGGLQGRPNAAAFGLVFGLILRSVGAGIGALLGGLLRLIVSRTHLSGPIDKHLVTWTVTAVVGASALGGAWRATSYVKEFEAQVSAAREIGVIHTTGAAVRREGRSSLGPQGRAPRVYPLRPNTIPLRWQERDLGFSAVGDALVVDFPGTPADTLTRVGLGDFPKLSAVYGAVVSFEAGGPEWLALYAEMGAQGLFLLFDPEGGLAHEELLPGEGMFIAGGRGERQEIVLYRVDDGPLRFSSPG